MADAGGRNVYSWTASPILGLIAWVLVILVEVVTCVSLLRDRPDAPALAPIAFGVLGVSFGGGLLLTLAQYELTIEGRGLTFRRRRLFSGLLGMRWVERWIPRDSISAFRLDKSPWRERKLIIVVDDGTLIGVQGGSGANVDSRFNFFVSTFRLFAERDSDHKITERTNAWLLPARRALVGGIVLAGTIVSVLSISVVLSANTSMDRPKLLVVAVFTAAFAVDGLRFLLKRQD